MIEGIDAEDLPLTAPGQSPWRRQLWRRLSLPLVLLLGLFVFLTAVGIDSLQQAAAADMSGQSLHTAQAAAASPRWSARQVTPAQPAPNLAGTYLEFSETTAKRLSHSDFVGSQLTRSRLTSSHLLLRNSQ